MERTGFDKTAAEQLRNYALGLGYDRLSDPKTQIAPWLATANKNQIAIVMVRLVSDQTVSDVTSYTDAAEVPCIKEWLEQRSVNPRSATRNCTEAEWAIRYGHGSALYDGSMKRAHINKLRRDALRSDTSNDSITPRVVSETPTQSRTRQKELHRQTVNGATAKELTIASSANTHSLIDLATGVGIPVRVIHDEEPFIILKR